jgi:integrase
VKEVHHGHNAVASLSSPRSLEQRQADWAESPFKPKDVWALRVRLQQERRARELALVNLGIDSKLRACDLVSLKVRDITHGERVASRAIVPQKKTGRPVQFEITTPAREALEAWIQEATCAGSRPVGRRRWCPLSSRSGHLCTLRARRSGAMAMAMSSRRRH